MTKKLLSNKQFQIRLVKEIRNGEIITYQTMANLGKRDKTLRLLVTEQSALQVARNYCNRSDVRKGLPVGQEFNGVVLSWHEDVRSNPKPIPTTIPQSRIHGGSKERKVGTTTWLYYVDKSCKAFYVDDQHRVGKEVE